MICATILRRARFFFSCSRGPAFRWHAALWLIAAASVAMGGCASSAPSGSSAAGDDDIATLTMDPFNVPAGSEVYYCQSFVNPFGGVDANISEFDSHMTTGSHHMLLFYADVTANTGAAPCADTGSFVPTPYSAQSLDDTLVYPDGIAALLPGTSGLTIQSHYLNITASPVTAHVEVLLHRATCAITAQAAVLFASDKDINVAPRSSGAAADDCTIPQDMQVLRTTSHMHQHGTSFLASIAGSTVYDTTSWSDPTPALWSPPIAVKAGAPLHFQCSYTNPGTTTLTYGESALTDEMCIFTATFYPAPPGVATIGAHSCVTSQP
jgi:hypothetical protein